jgi:aspartate/methionine/tyrosine aminotransferase
MWFKRMTLEVWFDDYQYEIEYEIGESAVKWLTVGELDINLGEVALRYGYHTGRPALKEVIAEQYPGLNSEHVVVTSGASEANFAVVSAIVRPGDHVVVEHPTYASLYEVPRSLGCDVDLLTLQFEDRFRPRLERLQRLVRPATKLISFTHPNNPTGSMITADELQELVEFVEERGIYLLFDETYREMDFQRTLPPAATLSDRVISISSMSKCYGLPGIRIGWAATQNQAILDQLLAIREQVSICNNAVGETIAHYVLERKEAFLAQAQAHIEHNHRLVSRWMAQQDRLEWIDPPVGVVAFPRIKAEVEVDPERLYRTLAEQWKTFVVPGRCFEMDNRYFRLGFGGTPRDIEGGLHNLGQALEELAG